MNNRTRVPLMTRNGRSGLAAFLVAISIAPGLAAQQPAAPVSLAELQRAALARDARAVQRDILSQSHQLRVRTIRDALKPRFTVSASNTHASDVTFLPVTIPGSSIPIPPRDRWSGAVDVLQVLYDGGGAAQREAVETARLAESVAGVDAAIEPLRTEVTGTFFAAALLQASERELESAIVDLEAVLSDTRVRVREGAALGRDSAMVRAEWLSVQARLTQARSARRAAVTNLERLTGIAIAGDAPLALPDWTSVLDALETSGDVAALRARPEFVQLARARDRVDRERGLGAVENRPRVVAFAETGYGRPGLNQFRADPQGFWQAGVRVEWNPFTWGSAARSDEVAVLQERMLTTEEKALGDRLARAVQADLENRARLKDQLAVDDEVIALRELALTQGEAQRREGVITAAESVSLRSDVSNARLARERHRVEIAQAEANIATTLGLVPR